MTAPPAWRLCDADQLRDRPEGRAASGGKGRSLLRLLDWDMPVPPFLVLTSDTVAAWLEPLRERIAARLAAADLNDAAQCAAAAAEIGGWIAAHPLDAVSVAATLSRCRDGFGPGYRCAVRSSASAEDGDKDSFAGQLDTYLHVGEADLLDRMRACIASLYGARALHYRHRRGLAAGEEGIAVVVQRMVPASRAGVLFSMNAGGNLNEIVVAAAYGLGEGVVGDRADSDHYFIARDSSRGIHRQIALKEARLDPDPQCAWGLRANPVAPEQRAASVLSDPELRRLGDLALELERRQECPQDLEFAYDESGTLFLLQARPITTLGTASARDWVILDNANIIESYPGVTLPLGFDFARLAYRHVFAAAARAFGIPAGWIAAHAEIFEHLLAHLNGRVYYRLDNARRVTSQVLTSVASQRAWQDFLGLSSLPWPVNRPGTGAQLRAAFRLARLALFYRSGNRRLATAFDAELRDLRIFVDGIEARSPAEIWAFFDARSAALFAAWAPTIVNDYFAMKTHDVLRRQLARLSDDAGLANDLLCGIQGLASEAPYLALLALKRRIVGDAELRALFARPAQEVAAAIARSDAAIPGDFRLAWDDYLREFGDRTLEELKLERPTLRMRPDLLAAMLQNQLSAPPGADAARGRQRTVRADAEARLDRLLRGHPFRRWMLGKLLFRARQAVRDREAMRINRARAFGKVKEMFHALGRAMHARGLLESPEQVFALHLAELRAFARDGDMTDRRETAAERLRDAVAQAAYDMPDRLIFPPGERPDLRHYAKAGGDSQSLAEGLLRHGLGVSRGVVEAPALVLDSPELTQRIDGQILVTRMTDPGWVFLMTQAGGIVSEKGSLLSHTAIIGRELGIPTVVGVKGATAWLRDGARICLDGAAGTVEKVVSAMPDGKAS